MNDTTWRLEEFDRHLRRLTDVSTSVAAAGKKTQQATDANGGAFGFLFGWAVTPALNALCGDVGGFSASLSEAVSASSDGISESRKLYALTEQDNVDRTREVEQELNEARGRIR